MTENAVKWTPGPFRVEGSIYEHMAFEIVDGTRGKGVAQVWIGPNANDYANLFAAAPEMAEALRPFGNIDFSGTVWEGNGIADETPVFLNRAGQTITVGDFRRAAAALKKAGG